MTGSATLLPPSPLGRFAFRALLPSLLLPVAATLLGYVGAEVRQGGVEWLVTAGFCLVLVGSMTVNAWLLLRHPASWLQRALPQGLAVALVVLWAATLVGGVLAATTSVTPATTVVAVVIMAASVVVCVMAVIRRTVRVAATPEVAVGLSRYGAALGWGYLVVAVVALLFGVWASLSTGPIALVLSFSVAGLPWSWPIAVVGIVAGAFQSSIASLVVAALIVAGVVVNVIVVVRLLIDPAFRVRFVNWFFRLRAADPASQIRT